MLLPRNCSVLVASFLLLSSPLSEARERGKVYFEPSRYFESILAAENPARDYYTESATDTYCLVRYDFETMNWQGWTRLDLTAQIDTFFHVDDFVGLGGGDFGLLVPIEGTKSMWCGVRPAAIDPYICSWQSAPGYGNGWDQALVTDPMAVIGTVTFSYRISYDSEPDYDFVYVEYDDLEGWQKLTSYNGRGSAAASHSFLLSRAATKIRFRFVSDGAWDDEDGLWNTDGACIVDSLVVRDASTYYNFEDFESASVGARRAGIWNADVGEAFGLHSGLKSNLGLFDKDPCHYNLSSQVVFFFNSPMPSIEYPGLYDTPFCKGEDAHSAPCQYEMVVSPPIDTRKYSSERNYIQDATIPTEDLPSLGGYRLSYTVYADLPLRNLVFRIWRVRSIIDGCPGEWSGDFYYGRDRLYYFENHDISRYVEGDSIQVAVGIRDMCDLWYSSYGDCAAHTPAPWYDNVAVYRYRSTGPQWAVRDIDLFQDNFPSSESDIESFVRADAALDVNPAINPVILPRDEIQVDCAAPASGGIAQDPQGGPAVYLHVRCKYIGASPAKPDLFGPALAGSVVIAQGPPPVMINFRYVSDDGEWTVIQCDSVRVGGQVVPGRYMVDLNDELFTRGYRIDYYFTARSADGIESSLPQYARCAGRYFEWTCLPTLNSEVLFVDDSRWSMRETSKSPAETYWQIALSGIGDAYGEVDRYHVNGSYYCASNGLGSRARASQLEATYRVVIWESGDNYACTISDGIEDKSNDCRLLIDWMNYSEHDCGLWVCGDNVASDLLDSSSPDAQQLLGFWCGVDVIASSYFDLTGGYSGGGVVNPILTGDPDAGVYVHEGAPDSMYAYGGCPVINNFDVLGKKNNGMFALAYPAFGGNAFYAAIACANSNSAAFTVRTMWFGVGYQFIFDDGLEYRVDRIHIAMDTFDWMMLPFFYVGTDPIPAAFRLEQNWPNPFNPTTTIRYSVPSRAFVTVEIYDVTGRLVRNLVKGTKDPGSYSATWNGRNDLGAAAASGLYFCRMQAGSFSSVKKIVLLR